MHAHSARAGVDLQLTTSLAEDQAFYQGPPTQLNLVLVNLLSNAAKFTDSGEIELRVNAVRGGQGFQVLKFSVTDTGPGVSKDMQEKIFGFRGQAGTAEAQIKGFGIGLYVASEVREDEEREEGGELYFLFRAFFLLLSRFSSLLHI